MTLREAFGSEEKEGEEKALLLSDVLRTGSSREEHMTTAHQPAPEEETFERLLAEH
jgi:hypothetical protein